MKIFKLGFVGVVFLLGMYFISMRDQFEQSKESFVGNSIPQCPDLLVQENGKLHLYNRRLAKVPGVNPVVFDSLNDYVQFMNWQRSQGIHCKVMYLEKGFNTQGESDYSGWRREDWSSLPQIDASDHGYGDQKFIDRKQMRILTDSSSGVTAFSSFDPQDQLIGLRTPLDRKFSRKSKLISANPMDTNWGGHSYTVKNTPEIKYGKRREKKLLARNWRDRGSIKASQLETKRASLLS
tara:strand:+ start:4435 stop:5145 length:711 start_codon:yes stop_codon:yes gene_type:complete